MKKNVLIITLHALLMSVHALGYSMSHNLADPMIAAKIIADTQKLVDTASERIHSVESDCIEKIDRHNQRQKKLIYDVTLSEINVAHHEMIVDILEQLPDSKKYNFKIEIAKMSELTTMDIDLKHDENYCLKISAYGTLFCRYFSLQSTELSHCDNQPERAKELSAKRLKNELKNLTVALKETARQTRKCLDNFSIEKTKFKQDLAHQQDKSNFVKNIHIDELNEILSLYHNYLDAIKCNNCQQAEDFAKEETRLRTKLSASAKKFLSDCEAKALESNEGIDESKSTSSDDKS